MLLSSHPIFVGSKIVSFGHYQPGKVLTNDELPAAFGIDTSDEWIRARVGIQSRHIGEPHESVAFMAACAGDAALLRAGLSARAIDLVIVATLSAEDRCPNIASQVARRLGVQSAATMDVNTACSGFCHALAVADHALRAGTAINALVIGSEKMMNCINLQDRATSVLFGDGAGAAVVTRVDSAEEVGVGAVVWGGDPEKGEALLIAGGNPLVQDGLAVFRWATSLAPVIRLVVSASGLLMTDIDALILHQANTRIIDPLAKKLGLRSDVVVARDIVESGNTSAASIPIALSKLASSHQLRAGATALLFGFGGGLTYAGQVIKMP